MAAVHEHTLRLLSSVSHVQLGCNGTYLALPHTRSNVGVWSLQDITCKPLELEGHRKPVTALGFGRHTHPTLLCSCANDYVIIWNIDKARASYEAGQQIRGHVIGTTLGQVQYCAFNEEDQMVAVCVDRDVIILSSQREQIIARLEGHISRVNCAEFCPHYTATLVSCADDRTFKIWDIDQASLIYQSTIISSSPFISMTMDPLMEALTLGTADGQIRIYDLKDGNGFRCLHHVDVQKLSNKIRNSIAIKRLEKQSSTETKGPVLISSRPSWQRGEAGLSVAQDGAEEEEPEIGCSILHIMYSLKSPRAASVMSGRSKTPTPAHLPFLQDDSLVQELLENAPTLVVVTNGALFQINARTMELCSFINLQDPLPSASIIEETCKSLPLTGSVMLAQSLQNNQIFCALGAMFGNEVNVLRVMPPDDNDVLNLKTVLSMTNLGLSEREQSPGSSSEGSESAMPAVITVLSSTPVLANSPLKAELQLKPKETPTGRRGSLKTSLTKRASSLGNVSNTDQPLVVHTKVKSSGYNTESPRKTMFQPQTNQTQQSPSKTRQKRQSVGILSKLTKEYPMNSKAPTHIKEKLDVAERPTAINAIKFSPSGLSLGCALANTSAQVFKLPLTGKGLSFNGHNGSVTSFCWSNDNKWIVTASDDKTANLWSLSVPDPVMTFSFVNDNFGTDKEGGLKPSKENPIFNKSVRFAQFYYMDKFIILTSGNNVYLYKYHVDTSKSDIKRYLSNNRYKLVKEFQMDQAQQITAFSAVNSFHSYIALAAGSNKTVEVYDMNVATSIRTMTDVHSRPVHTICQNQGSPYVTHPSIAYDLFLTAAANDCLKLWDLRSDRCVRRYEGHANRIYPCGVAISPCSRFIATGSEDRCAYIFDIRSGTYVHKLTGHTDTVGDVEYHPLHPQLVTASLDGRLRLFTEL